MNRIVRRIGWTLLVAFVAIPAAAFAQARGSQAIDEEYTRLIAEHLQDDRITTELVDHLPASETVPTPLDFHGRIVGTPGELTYATDIHRYMRAIADASPRATVLSMGLTEENREMILMVIADEQTIADLETYKGYMAELTDPRVTSDERARQLIDGVAKPIYWLTSGMHSTENGGPEMLQELAYRLVVQESDFIRSIRENVITFITPVIEVDGREKQVDTFYFNESRPEGEARLPLMYWGKYVAHDNNRDAMGQMLALTKHVNATQLEWNPVVMHDLHEAQNYLYTSTGTGPYNEAFDAITITEWWMFAENDVLQMTKRGVPGVWTYSFYDGWTPNYMFTIAHGHNAVGRFYEVASYGPNNRTLRVGETGRSREWFRPNPPLAEIEWGPRNNTNIQQSGVLFSLKYAADNASLLLDNYWTKNKRSIQTGIDGPVNAWVIPAEQRRRADAADAVNELMRQGLEIHRADDSFEAGDVEVRAGDYVIRADQPFRTLADMYLSLQQFSLDNPRPYDDTGWTFQLLRNIELDEIADPDILAQDMTLLTDSARVGGGISGRGSVVVVDHTTDNNLMKFRFRHAELPMHAAEVDFEMDGRSFRAGTFIIPDAPRDIVDASLAELGLIGYGAGELPDVPMHELDVPRIGYLHSWRRTQDEGWVRGTLDHYGVPYEYFADKLVAEGNLRERFDVIIYPHVGGDADAHINGVAITGELPLPYKRTTETPNLGGIDESDDIRGGMGWNGLVELANFVQEGGLLLVEGSTATIMPEYGVTAGLEVVRPEDLVAPGSVHRGIIEDDTSPIAYGYAGGQVPVYYKADVVFSEGGGGGGFGRGPWQNTTPMANRPRLSDWENPDRAAGLTSSGGGGFGGFRGFGGGGGSAADNRVIVRFPSEADHILLSGALSGAESLAGAPQVVDSKVGDGHVVSFAIRPFWRWQTQGTFFLGFNAILNWNDLDADGSGEVTVTEEGGGRN
ncbi:MAG: M14 family zinc carboxypeptidase [Gemmatimonadota bacterium]|nr:M14 family zinc carboxypeptidase [Gemmatimonadota bacterium]